MIKNYGGQIPGWVAERRRKDEGDVGRVVPVLFITGDFELKGRDKGSASEPQPAAAFAQCLAKQIFQYFDSAHSACS